MKCLKCNNSTDYKYHSEAIYYHVHKVNKNGQISKSYKAEFCTLSDVSDGESIICMNCGEQYIIDFLPTQNINDIKPEHIQRDYFGNYRIEVK